MTKAHKLFLKWLSQISLIIFFIFLAYDQGLITKILSSDKSFITSVILVLFGLVSVHCAFFTFLVSEGIESSIYKKKFTSRNVKLKIIQNSLIFHI